MNGFKGEALLEITFLLSGFHNFYCSKFFAQISAVLFVFVQLPQFLSYKRAFLAKSFSCRKLWKHPLQSIMLFGYSTVPISNQEQHTSTGTTKKISKHYVFKISRSKTFSFTIPVAKPHFRFVSRGKGQMTPYPHEEILQNDHMRIFHAVHCPTHSFRLRDDMKAHRATIYILYLKKLY